MVTQPIAADRTAGSRSRATAARLLYTLTVTTVAMCLLLVAWLMARGITGHLKPLGFVPLTFVGLVSAGLASLLRAIWLRLNIRPSQLGSRAMLVWATPSFVLVLFGFSLSIRGTESATLVMFWSIILLAELIWWWPVWRRIAGGATAVTESFRPPSGTCASRLQTSPADEEEAELDENDEHEAWLADDVSQQLTRSWAEEDQDNVTGLLRTRFEPHERSRSLHVAICPPMLHRPQVTVTQLSGPRTRIKTGDCQPFGVRFDVRLAAPSDQQQDVLIHFEARCGKPEGLGVGGTQHQ